MSISWWLWPSWMYYSIIFAITGTTEKPLFYKHLFLSVLWYHRVARLLLILRKLFFWILGARGNTVLSDPGTPDQHQASQTHPPFPVGPQVSITQLLHLGWFYHINNQINNNELNPINSNRAKMVINFCMKSYMTTLFIKYSQENMCLQKSLLKEKVGFNHVEIFFSFKTYYI